MPSAVIYKYLSLPTLTSFRTLVLYPQDTNKDSPIQGRLQINELQLNDKPLSDISFETLSYVWGSSDLTHVIHMGKHKVLRITANLHAALKALRLREYPEDQSKLGCDLPSGVPQWGTRTIWADGICINQADIVEKSEQVCRMGLYYEYAARTIIYLGVEANNSHLAKPLLVDVWSNMQGPRSTQLPPQLDPSWGAVAALFLRPWWTRYWIIQEVVRSKDVLVVCGSWTLPWDMFTGAARWADEQNLLPSSTGADAESSHRGRRGLANLITLRSTIQQHRKWTLIDLLERCRMASCSDHRDYIYALLGLCIEVSAERTRVRSSPISGQASLWGAEIALRPNFAKEDFVVNYAEEAGPCFTRFASYMVGWGDGIKILYSACYNERRTDTPSWVPNWASEELHWRSLAPKFDLGPDPWYCAASAYPVHIELSDKPGDLVVKVVFVDTIREVGRLLSKGPTDNVMTRDLDVVASAANDLLSFLRTQKQTQHKSSPDSIWRVLCCDLDTASNKGPASPDLSAFLQPTLAIARNWEALLTGQWQPASSRELSTEETSRFLMNTAPMCLGRRPMITESGWMGMVPEEARTGDVIFVPLGSAVPMVMREELGGFILIGECFVDGIMGGELLVKEVLTYDITLL